MKKTNIISAGALLSLIAITSCTTELNTILDIDLSNNPTSSKVVPVTNWGVNKKELKSSVSEDFVLVEESENELIYEFSGDEELLQAYQFDKQGNLETSLIMMPSSSSFYNDAQNVINKFESRGKKNDTDVYSNEDAGIVATKQIVKQTDSKSYYVFGFATYSPSQGVDEDAPYVDLGLSVCWAKCNVGASAPEKSGKFFAWSETTEKTSYWRENYSFCDTDDGYIFNYYNPLSEISGTKYDAATYVCGEDWRMPTKEEANELIYYCTWKEATVNGVSGFEVTGPNGNSIFLPKTPYKYQDKEKSKYEIWTGSAISRTHEEAYIIKFPTNFNDNKPQLDNCWKAWGHAIRPVYDPK